MVDPRNESKGVPNFILHPCCYNYCLQCSQQILHQKGKYPVNIRIAKKFILFVMWTGRLEKVYGFQKDQISIRTCWGEAGGFLDTTKLSEKVTFVYNLDSQK